MRALTNLAFLSRTAYFVIRRPRLHRDTANVLDEYSDGWNLYWDYLKRARTLSDWLRIPGVDDRPSFYAVEGRVRFQVFDSANFYQSAILSAFEANFPTATSVTEFGSGLGRNLLYLKSRKPQLTLCGYELCRPGVEIAREASKKFGMDCQYSELNYVTGRPEEYVFPHADVSFTLFSLEQIPRENKKAIENIHRHSKLGSIHLEPVVEHYPFSLRGLLGRLDHWKVDYLRSFDKNVRSLNMSSIASELLSSSHNPLMYPSLYVLRK
jgi:hypothetical protein